MWCPSGHQQHADVWETDTRWTYDPVGADPVMVLSHDSTTDRVFNCSYVVSSTLWSTLRDKCRTRIASQQMFTLNGLVALAKASGKDLQVEIKQPDISNWKAHQFYNAVKAMDSHVMVTAFDGGPLRSLHKVKALDAADPYHGLRYGLLTSYLPTLSQVKAVGWNLCIRKDTITKAQVMSFRGVGIHVYLWIGYTRADYQAMVDKDPNGVTVNDPEDFYQWLNSLGSR